MTRWWWREFRLIFNFRFVCSFLDYRRLLLFLFHVDVTFDWLQRAVEHLVAAAAAAADPPLFSRVVSVSDGFDESADDADGIIISDTAHETRPLWEALSTAL